MGEVAAFSSPTTKKNPKGFVFFKYYVSYINNIISKKIKLHLLKIYYFFQHVSC